MTLLRLGLPQSISLSSKPPQKIEGFTSHPQLQMSAAEGSPDCHQPILDSFTVALWQAKVTGSKA